MWTHNLNPTLLSFGPLEIRWYGLVYVLGFFLSLWWMLYLQKKKKLELTKDQIWDLSFWLLLGVLIGSRLFEIFWEPRYYFSNPLNLFKIWQGGMSFHGGFVGIVLACWFYCKKQKINFWKMADILSIPTILALTLGRIANFINGELVGRVWNGRWCVIFPDYDQQCRHPSILYAAAYRFIIFGELLWLSFWKEFKPGFIFWNFVIWEGLGRFIIDFYREDVLHFGFSIGQWFSLIMIIIALFFFAKYYQEDWKKIFTKAN